IQGISPLNWNKWVRQIHRWLSIAFTLTVIANFIAMGLGNPPAWVVYSPCSVSATIAGASGILARAQFGRLRPRTGRRALPFVPARGRRRLPHGNREVRRTPLPEYPDITLYIEHLRSRISNQPLEEVRLASPFFLRSVDVPIGATKGKRVVELRR